GRQHGERPVEEGRRAPGRSGGGAGARGIVVIALHGVFQVLVGHLYAADELDPASPVLPHPLRLAAHLPSLRRERCCPRWIRFGCTRLANSSSSSQPSGMIGNGV